MLSDEGVAMLCGRGYLKPDRTGTIVGIKGDNCVVRWDGNARQTVKRYARRYIKIIQQDNPTSTETVAKLTPARDRQIAAGAHPRRGPRIAANFAKLPGLLRKP